MPLKIEWNLHHSSRWPILSTISVASRRSWNSQDPLFSLLITYWVPFFSSLGHGVVAEGMGILNSKNGTQKAAIKHKSHLDLTINRDKVLRRIRTGIRSSQALNIIDRSLKYRAMVFEKGGLPRYYILSAARTKQKNK